LLNRFWFSEKRVSVDESAQDWLIAGIPLSEATALNFPDK
jgi:hypothetical protein